MLEQEQPDVEVESSPTQAEQPAETAQAESAPAEAAPEKEVPFHEHPRFRELVEQKNQYAEELQRQKTEFARMQAQFESLRASQPKVESETEKLYKDLEAVDPRLAKHLRSLEERASMAESVKKDADEFKQWQQAQQQEAVRSQAMNELSRLHSEYKVPKELTGIYEAQIRAMAAANPQLGIKDLASAYKSVHDQLNGYIEAEKRRALTGYTAAKKTDAKAPTALSKGQAPGAKKQEYSKNSEEAKAQLIKNIVSRSRAESDI